MIKIRSFFHIPGFNAGFAAKNWGQVYSFSGYSSNKSDPILVADESVRPKDCSLGAKINKKPRIVW